MTERYPGAAGRSEYGGGDGTVQRLPDGASLDLPGIASASGKRAALLRKAGMNDFDPASADLVGMASTGLRVENMTAAQREAYQADLAESVRRSQERARLNAATNGYISEPDQYSGEQIV